MYPPDKAEGSGAVKQAIYQALTLNLVRKDKQSLKKVSGWANTARPQSMGRLPVLTL